MPKRALSLELVAKRSPFHASVTLFSDPSTSTATPDTESVLRRSKRVKVDVSASTSLIKLEDTHVPLKTRSSRNGKAKQPDLTPVSQVVRVKMEEAEAEETEFLVDEAKPKRQRMKREGTSSPRKPKSIPQSLDTPHPAPPNWQDTYDTIQRMRDKIVAPVDTMGCEQAQTSETVPQNRRFSTLISLMLSSQTKDEITDAAVKKLRRALGGSITIAGVIEADESTISEAIAKVGFWRRKTQYIKQTARRLRDDFDSDVPKTVDELCSLPGVGPKMAFLALQVAWQINVGIGVDVHVHRITNRLRWHNPPTKTPEQTRLNLQSWLPTELHPKINLMLVGFGQTMCLPVGPRCGECELSDGRCPSATKSSAKPVKGRKTSSSTRAFSGPKLEIEIETVKFENVKTEDAIQSLEDPLSPLSDDSSGS